MNAPTWLVTPAWWMIEKHRLPCGARITALDISRPVWQTCSWSWTDIWPFWGWVVLFRGQRSGPVNAPVCVPIAEYLAFFLFLCGVFGVFCAEAFTPVSVLWLFISSEKTRLTPTTFSLDLSRKLSHRFLGSRLFGSARRLTLM